MKASEFLLAAVGCATSTVAAATSSAFANWCLIASICSAFSTYANSVIFVSSTRFVYHHKSPMLLAHKTMSIQNTCTSVGMTVGRSGNTAQDRRGRAEWYLVAHPYYTDAPWVTVGRFEEKRYVHRLKHGDNATDVEVKEDKDADTNVDDSIGQQRGFFERRCDGLIFLFLIFRSILYRNTFVVYCQDAKDR
ncbi:hypothetical protein PsorP6_003653 [Peronosclerospora sorghi]|uniref:Uncharacterized protein n=1 Tax=Peronosclerospora sorghi TaxID=230839 RepID=A0ACC0VQE9_9STRA|nr:hypothetical protein PsorP6_003653 [Peronosclerospora sorghi]